MLILPLIIADWTASLLERVRATSKAANKNLTPRDSSKRRPLASYSREGERRDWSQSRRSFREFADSRQLPLSGVRSWYRSARPRRKRRKKSVFFLCIGAAAVLPRHERCNKNITARARVARAVLSFLYRSSQV